MKKLFIVLSLCIMLAASSAWPMVSSSTSRIQYNCNGSTVAFTFGFGVNATSEVQVVHTDSAGTETVLTETTDYTVTCTNSDCSAGGTVTTVDTYDSGETITLLRAVPITQEADFTENRATLYETFEDGLDKSIRIDQQLQEQIDRTPKLARTSTYAGNDYTLPDPEAGKVIGWNAGATDLTTYSTTSGTTLSVTTIEKVGSYATLAAAVTAIGASEKTLLIDQACAVTDDLTVPSNIHLWVVRGGSFNVSAGKTLTVNGYTSAGFWKIKTGTGRLSFGAGAVSEVLPAWWGAVGDGSTDCASAIEAALEACSMVYSSHGGKMVLASGSYNTESEITVPPGLDHVIIEGVGSYGSFASSVNGVNIVYSGAAAATGAVMRATAGATGGFFAEMRNISIDAGGLAGYGFVSEGTAGSTYNSRWTFYRCSFSRATKIGCIVGDTDGTPDVNTMPTLFSDCFWDGSPIGLYVNADNAYGVTVFRGHFVSDSGNVINHIRGDLSADLRIVATYFSTLQCEAATVNPITGIAVADEDIKAVYASMPVTIDKCFLEDQRVLYLVASSTAMSQSVIRDTHVKKVQATDSEGRDLDWTDGASTGYSIYVESGNLAIEYCQIGNSSATDEAYRRIYVGASGSISIMAKEMLLGTYGKVDYAAGGTLRFLNAKDSLKITPNGSLSHWQSDGAGNDVLLGFFAFATGVGGAATYDYSSSQVVYGKYTAKVSCTTTPTTVNTGLTTYFGSPTSRVKTFIVAGYATTWAGLSAYKSAGMTKKYSLGSGSLWSYYDAVTKRFIGCFPFTIDNTTSNEQHSVTVGIPANKSGTYYFDVVGITDGEYTLDLVSAMLEAWGVDDQSRDSSNFLSLYGTATPSVGQYRRGDIIWNRQPSSGGDPGWICVSGTGVSAGTWKGIGDID